MSTAKEYMHEILQPMGWGATESEYSKSDSSSMGGYRIPTIIRFPLYQFVSDDMTIVSDKPVEVTVFYEDKQYFASSESLNIFAVGDSVGDLMNDFAQHVVYFFNYYRDKDNVIGDAARLKDIFARHFVLVG